MQDPSVTIANVALPGWAAILIALAVCFALGAVNAFGLTRIGIPSFIMTLAMLQIAAGICALLVRGQIAYTVPPLILTLGSHSLGPVPWIVIVAALFLLVVGFVLKGAIFHATGAELYNARVADLRGSEGMVEQVGGWVMQADPVTLWVADKVALGLMKIKT